MIIDTKRAQQVISDTSGFSLLELIISISVASVIGIILVVILVQNNGVLFQQNAKVSQGLTINNTALQINDSIRSASGVVASNLVGSPTFQTSAQTLVLAIPSLNPQGAVIPNVSDYLIITKDTQKPKILKKIIFVDPQSSRKSENMVLATTLKNLSFEYFNDQNNPVTFNSATKINYVLNLDETSGLLAQESSASGEVNLRND